LSDTVLFLAESVPPKVSMPPYKLSDTVLFVTERVPPPSPVVGLPLMMPRR
jgi:hypothetical protein